MNKCDSVFEKVPAHQEIQIESEHETEEQVPEKQERNRRSALPEEDEEWERREAFKLERAKLRESTAAFTNAR